MKSWEARIRSHIEHWKRRVNPSFWPKFVYHFTDIHNAVGIVENGCLFSRDKAQELGLMSHNNASESVLESTPNEHKQFVRFYYAPRTPTQYNNEGIRPFSERNDGHCPVPIFFAFDAYDLMTRDAACFSNGNMGASGVEFGPDEADFDRIPFEMVFHRDWFPPEERDEIVFHRHAELLIPDEVKLDHSLSWVGCRSVAERRTFLHMLGNNIPDSFRNIVRVADSSVYERKWAYVNNVTYQNNRLIIDFNESSLHSSEFTLKLNATLPDGSFHKLEWMRNCKDQFVIGLKRQYEYLDIELLLDDCLAFRGVLSPTTEDIV